MLYNNNEDYQKVLEIANKVKDAGGTCYFVGGYVRDVIQGIPSKDYDIEVYGIYPNQLEEILATCGTVIKIGVSFGIYNLKHYDIDIAMPRIEKLIGTGHKDFEIEVDPFINLQDACKRRDFTFNAMLQNVLTGEIIDFYHGQDDLKNKIVRHVNDESFKEDPLRVLRGCMFAARFGFDIDPKTLEFCQSLDITNLSKERIYGELTKVFLKAKKPSIFFEYLRKMNQLGNWFKEVQDLIGIEQNPIYHPEGDVWNHTMQVIDAGALVLDKISDVNKINFMLACLCHDFGKVNASKVDEKGVIHAIGHEKTGLPLIETFIKRLTNNKETLEYVLNMTLLHMKPNMYACDKSKMASTNKMFDEALYPIDLIYLAESDARGSGKVDYDAYLPFLFERYEIYQEVMKRPFVKGSDLIKLGYHPGFIFHQALAEAHKVRLNGRSYEEQLKAATNFLEKNIK